MVRLQPADRSIFDTASHIATTEVEVGADIERVWEKLSDHSSWPAWFPGCTAVQASPARWTGPGDTRTITINRMKVDEIALACEPEAEFSFTIVGWPLPIARSAAERVVLSDTSREGEDRTSLTWTGAFEMNRFGALIWSGLQSRLVDGWGTGFEQLHEQLANEVR
jgi:carbon monoxide dehydrogenase subunit G